MKEAVEIDRDIGNTQGEAIDLFNLASALDEYGDRTSAVSYAKKALTILTETNDPNAEIVKKQLSEWTH